MCNIGELGDPFIRELRSLVGWAEDVLAKI